MKVISPKVSSLFAFFLVCFLSHTSMAQQVIDLGSSGKAQLNDYLIVLNTTGKNISANDIVSGKHDPEFFSYASYRFPDKASEHWLRLRIKNATNQTQPYYIGTTLFDHIEFYFPSDSGKWSVQNGGILYPIRKKKFTNGPFSFADVSVPANGIITAYIKVINTKSAAFQFISLKPTIFTQDDFRFEYGNIHKYNLVFLGIVLIMALYNFILLFITNERAYLYYVGYNIFVLLYSLVLNGEIVQRFFPDSSEQQKLVLFTGIGSYIFYIFFSKKMLELEKFYPKWNNILFWIAFTTALMAIPTALNWLIIAIPVCFFNAIAGYLLIFSSAIVLTKKKHVPAMYFLAASFFYLTSQFVAILQMLSILPSSIVGLHAPLIVQLGIASELALLSLGLGARIISIREKTLKESEQKLTQYLEAVPVGIFVIDKNGTPFYANHTAQVLLGKKVVPQVGKAEIAEVYRAYRAGTDRLYPQEELPVVLALNGKSSTIEDMELRRPDGAITSLEVSARPIYDENNKIIYAIAVFQDITQRVLSKRQLEEYSQTLEQKVIERTEEISRQKNTIEKEKQKSDSLLLNILPEETAEELKATGRSVPKRYEKATVMFTDFVNFSMRSEEIGPDELINEINYYFSSFDSIISKYNLEKIKTIGDSYMCAGGLPVANSTHPQDMVEAALEIREFILQVKRESQAAGKRYFDCRIGIHTGPLVAGIAGIQKFAYDIWGDTVNIASRMESSCEPNMINISGSTYSLVKDCFKCSYRGKIESKHNRFIEMYYVDEKSSGPDYKGAEKFILARLMDELPSTLCYHGFHHTLDVMDAAMKLSEAEELPEEEKKLLRIAVAFHDAGFIYMYKDHEERSCEMAREILPSFGFSEEQTSTICGMIMTTKIPQQPKTLAEKIIADADLDYLGREDVLPIAQTLFDELKIHANITEEGKWNQVQIRFLKDHYYHTQYAIQQRGPKKQLYLETLLNLAR